MRHPALALLDMDSVARGLLAADVMVKRSPIALMKTGTVHPGRFLILIAGTVASVEEAFAAGVETAGVSLVDSILLPEVHAEVYDAALGARLPVEMETLGVVETETVACLLAAADAARKGTDVQIVEIRLADDLGGRAFVLLHGSLHDVEAALEIATDRVRRAAARGEGTGTGVAEQTVQATIMPRLDDTVRRIVDRGTRFAGCEPLQPEGAEIEEEPDVSR